MKKNARRPAKIGLKAPISLHKETQKWWKAIQLEYEIQDRAGLLILTTAGEAFDRMRQAQRRLRREGLTAADRFGQLKAHPATVIERDSRAAMLAALKQLNLDVEPLQGRPGRPNGR